MADDNLFYRNIFASILDGMIVVSGERKMIQVNPAAEEMFQQSRESFLHKSCLQLFDDSSGIENKIGDTLAGGASFHDIECRGIRKSGTVTFPLSLSISPFMNEDNEVQGAVLHTRDKSFILDLEETARQSDQISSLGILSLGMAHEIKNPLVAISGSAQLLRKRLPEEHHEFLDVVIKEADRINRMMDRMLDFARPVDPKKQSINIHQLIEEILVLEKKSGRIQFIQNYDPSLPPIEGNEDRLKQVFLNLIRNAVEAMPEGGIIQIVTRIHSNYTVKTLQNLVSKQGIVVEIIDSGTGINEATMKNLFTPFHTTKSKGSGLGLPISLKIVEDHRGKIKVISKPNQGTTVQVFLPVG